MVAYRLCDILQQSVDINACSSSRKPQIQMLWSFMFRRGIVLLI